LTDLSGRAWNASFDSNISVFIFVFIFVFGLESCFRLVVVELILIDNHFVTDLECFGFGSGERLSLVPVGKRRLVTGLISPFLSVVAESMLRIDVFAAGGYGVDFHFRFWFGLCDTVGIGLAVWLCVPLHHVAVAIGATDRPADIGVRGWHCLKRGLWVISAGAEIITCLVTLFFGIETVDEDKILASVGMSGTVAASPVESVVGVSGCFGVGFDGFHFVCVFGLSLPSLTTP
jgi:hypothetical protein